MENPFHYPSFIRSGGIIGQPISLSQQVCSRSSPGNIPIVAYDNSLSYSQGNGAIIENILFVPTGNTNKSVLFLFAKLSEFGDTWRLLDEFDLPAITYTATDKPSNAPIRLSPTNEIWRVSDDGSFPKGIRIPGNTTRAMQLGFALGTALQPSGTPLDNFVYLTGGEY